MFFLSKPAAEAFHEKGLGWNCVFPNFSFAAPVSGDEFYIVRDLATQKCTVVDKRPMTDTRTITLATDTIFKSRADAEAGMKGIKVCTGPRNKGWRFRGLSRHCSRIAKCPLMTQSGHCLSFARVVDRIDADQRFLLSMA